MIQSYQQILKGSQHLQQDVKPEKNEMATIEHHNFDVDIHIKSSNQKVKINADFIEVNNQVIFCKDVTGIKYGVSLIGSKKNPTSKLYTIEVKDDAGKTLKISFNSSKVDNILEEDHIYYYVMSGAWHNIKKHLINKYIDILNKGENFKIADLEVTPKGFIMSYKTWFFGKTKTDLLNWADSQHFLDKGLLHINGLSDKRKKAVLSLHYDWNAVVLNTLLHYLWQDHRKEKLTRGEKI